MSSDVPASGSTGAVPTTAIDGPAAVAPGFDLGPGLRAVAFAPGRFAAAIQRSLSGTHARNRVREDSTASLVLELSSDGTARGCRGWRYVMTNDGPTVHTDDRFREQAGFRGRYTERGGAIDVELTRDDQVCEPVAEYALVPSRATTITLRCALAVADGHPTLTAPVLVCQWTGAASPEREAHTVAALGPPGSIVLGAAPGLRVKLGGGLPGMVSTSESTITVTVDAVADGAWRSAF